MWLKVASGNVSWSPEHGGFQSWHKIQFSPVRDVQMLKSNLISAEFFNWRSPYCATAFTRAGRKSSEEKKSHSQMMASVTNVGGHVYIISPKKSWWKYYATRQKSQIVSQHWQRTLDVRLLINDKDAWYGLLNWLEQYLILHSNLLSLIVIWASKVHSGQHITLVVVF